MSKMHTHAHTTSELSESESVWLFATPWITAHQVPLSMGFSRQEYWSGLPCPPPGDPRLRDQTQVSCIISRFFNNLETREAPLRARKNMSKMKPEPVRASIKTHMSVWAQLRTLAASFGG